MCRPHPALIGDSPAQMTNSKLARTVGRGTMRLAGTGGLETTLASQARRGLHHEVPVYAVTLLRLMATVGVLAVAFGVWAGESSSSNARGTTPAPR
jgi:hypothetical protein